MKKVLIFTLMTTIGLHVFNPLIAKEDTLGSDSVSAAEKAKIQEIFSKFDDAIQKKIGFLHYTMKKAQKNMSKVDDSLEQLKSSQVGSESTANSSSTLKKIIYSICGVTTAISATLLIKTIYNQKCRNEAIDFCAHIALTLIPLFTALATAWNFPEPTKMLKNSKVTRANSKLADDRNKLIEDTKKNVNQLSVGLLEAVHVGFSKEIEMMQSLYGSADKVS